MKCPKRSRKQCLCRFRGVKEVYYKICANSECWWECFVWIKSRENIITLFRYSRFSHDVTAAILVSRPNPPRISLYIKATSENTIILFVCPPPPPPILHKHYFSVFSWDHSTCWSLFDSSSNLSQSACDSQTQQGSISSRAFRVWCALKTKWICSNVSF